LEYRRDRQHEGAAQALLQCHSGSRASEYPRLPEGEAKAEEGESLLATNPTKLKPPRKKIARFVPFFH
jgi:hypothetical protein